MTSPRSAPPAGDKPVVHSCWNGRVAGRYSHDGHTVVWAHGEIDMATAPDLTQELAEAVRAHPGRVIVDLSQVTFMDSTGFSTLVRARADSGNGELRLVGASGMVCEILRITGLEQVFPVHSTIEEAIGQGPSAHHNDTVTQHRTQAEFRG